MQCAMLTMQFADGVGSQLQVAHAVMVGVPFWLNVFATGSQGSQLMVERRAPERCARLVPTGQKLQAGSYVSDQLSQQPVGVQSQLQHGQGPQSNSTGRTGQQTLLDFLEGSK